MGSWFRVRVGPFGYTIRGRRRGQSYRAYKRSREQRERYRERYEREKSRRGTGLSVGDKLSIVIGIFLAMLVAPFVLVGYLIRRFWRFLRGSSSSAPESSDVPSDDAAPVKADEDDDEVLLPANEIGDDERQVKQPNGYEKVIENGRVNYENPEYDGKSVPTLRAWLKYWKEVAAGTRQPNPGDRLEMAPTEVDKLTAELVTRGFKP